MTTELAASPVARSNMDTGSGTFDADKVAVRSRYLVSPLKSKLVKCKATGPLNVPEKLNPGVPDIHPPTQVKPENCTVPDPIRSRVGALVCGITGPVPLNVICIAIGILPVSAFPAITA